MPYVDLRAKANNDNFFDDVFDDVFDYSSTRHFNGIAKLSRLHYCDLYFVSHCQRVCHFGLDHYRRFLFGQKVQGHKKNVTKTFVR